jgi:hypothetical protein
MGLTISFKVYDINDNLIAKSIGVITNFDNSEIEITIDSFFIKSSGSYYGYFTFIDLDNSTFSLPSPNSRTRIKLQYN